MKVSSKLKTFLILGALAFAVGVGAFLFLWQLAGGADATTEAEIDNCQWQSAAGKLKWQCQIKNSGFKRWSDLKMQIAVWSMDNVWQNLNGVALDNLGWGGQQDISGQADLAEGVWRVRAMVSGDKGEVLAQADKFWAQTAGDSAQQTIAAQTWFKVFLKTRLDWINSTTTTIVMPARGCSPRGCWQNCLAGLNLVAPALCAADDAPCQEY